MFALNDKNIQSTLKPSRKLDFLAFCVIFKRFILSLFRSGPRAKYILSIVLKCLSLVSTDSNMNITPRS